MRKFVDNIIAPINIIRYLNKIRLWSTRYRNEISDLFYGCHVKSFAFVASASVTINSKNLVPTPTPSI